MITNDLEQWKQKLLPIKKLKKLSYDYFHTMSFFSKLRQLSFKESVSLGAFLGIILFLGLALNTLGLIHWWNLQNYGFCLICIMGIFLIPITFTYGKIDIQLILGRMFEFVLNAGMDEKTKEEFLKFEICKIIRVNLELLNKKELKLRGEIPSLVFIMYWSGVFFLIWIFKIPCGHELLIALLIYCVSVLFGVKAPSIFQVARDMAKIFFSPSLTLEDKLVFVRKQIETLVGIGINLEMEQKINKGIPHDA